MWMPASKTNAQNACGLNLSDDIHHHVLILSGYKKT